MPSKILKHVTTDQDRCNSSLTASKEAFVTILILQFKFNFEHVDIVVSIDYQITPKYEIKLKELNCDT